MRKEKLAKKAAVLLQKLATVGFKAISLKEVAKTWDDTYVQKENLEGYFQDLENKTGIHFQLNWLWTNKTLVTVDVTQENFQEQLEKLQEIVPSVSLTGAKNRAILEETRIAVDKEEGEASDEEAIVVKETTIVETPRRGRRPNRSMEEFMKLFTEFFIETSKKNFSPVRFSELREKLKESANNSYSNQLEKWGTMLRINNIKLNLSELDYQVDIERFGTSPRKVAVKHVGFIITDESDVENLMKFTDNVDIISAIESFNSLKPANRSIPKAEERKETHMIEVPALPAKREEETLKFTIEVEKSSLRKVLEDLKSSTYIKSYDAFDENTRQHVNALTKISEAEEKYLAALAAAEEAKLQFEKAKALLS